VVPGKGILTDEQMTASFKKFTQKRRKDIYNDLNPAEQERFNAHMEAFNHTLRAKTEKFILSLPGPTIKMPPQVI
jgi:hypothetical protein